MKEPSVREEMEALKAKLILLIKEFESKTEMRIANGIELRRSSLSVNEGELLYLYFTLR